MIFNEDYDIADKYRLSDGEKVATVEMMPARFTSLDSAQYGPVLDAAAKEAINKYFNFKQLDTNDPNYSFDNDLYVYHLDGEYQEFFCKKFYTYSSVALNPYSWKRFVDGIGQPKFNDARKHFDSLTNVTDATNTWFNGITLSPTGDLISIRVFDSTYDLDELEDNDFLNRVNQIPLYRGDVCKGTIDVYPDSDLITYRLNFKYPKFFDDNYKDKGVLRYSADTRELAIEYLDLMSRDEGVQILTTDQVAFITSKLQGEAYFNLEFDVNPNGTVAEVYAYIQTTNEFEDLTTQ
tara:strand:- start:3107 stop:3985 length:879 start_codon:yes stop_codon:yes gene_type:complete